jgi:diacylglycerol kinase family enzyme
VRACLLGLAGSTAALAVLPAGTGNLLAANLGLPLDPVEGVRVAVAGGRRQVDLGEVDGELFAVMAGMGFDAAVMDSTSARLKARIGPLAYVLSAVPHLFGRPMRVQVLVDDNPALRRHARAVLVGNVGRLQGGIRLLPDAEPDNGRMDVAILAPRNLAHWAALALAVLLRRERVPRMQVIRGSHITISSDRPQPRELDGDVIEPAGTLEVSVRPSALWLCVPQPEGSPDLAEGS